MSLCDKCWAPGACCMTMHLTSQGSPITVWEGDDPAKELERRAGPHPFFPIDVQNTYTAVDGSDDTGRVYQDFNWGCTALDKPTGRCSIYADRPQLCKDYEAGSSQLCALYRGPDVPEDYSAKELTE